MADNYQWHGQTWSSSGCPGTYLAPGWYSGITPIAGATTYNNPTTGKPYTPSELSALGGGTTTTTIGTTTQTSTSIAPTASELEAAAAGTLTPKPQPEVGAFVPIAAEGARTRTPATPALTPSNIALPSLGSINVPAPAVTPAPAFELSPEQKAWQEKIGGYISETLEMGGRGIPQETMDLMVGKTIDTLKAKETEDLRVMKNNMERRGITNSGFTFSNEQKIRSGTTIALAKSITDLNIQNQLMKLASFENTMGQAAQFLGYLGEMSQLKYQPAYATWQAQQQANLYQYQAKMELYKTQLVQAYAQQNMQLQAQLNMQAQNDQQAFELQIAQMEIEASNQQATAEGIGSIFGAIIGGIFAK